MNEFKISQENWDKIIDYARIAYNEYKAEIGGMAIMMKDDEGDWHVMRPVILKQEISAANTSIDKEALAKYYTKEASYMQQAHPGLNYRFLWWHSHHTMAAFWSGTDHKAIEEFSDGDMSFALVVNLKQEYKFRISIWKPIEVAQDVDLTIVDRPDVQLPKKMIKEVKNLCSKETPITYGYNKSVRIGSKLNSQSALWEDVWGDTEEEDNPSDVTEMLFNDISYDPVLEQLMMTLDETNSKFVEGAIDVDKWHKKLTSMERKLKKLGHHWMLRIPSKSNAFETMLAISGFELIQPREVIE
tara:strand:- start:27643 stop:28542 length:900 start_codon:yes stop_codon:yes gene_type:complete